ncbi:MAG: L-glutamate gamma-semialdehyde dehydrogenase [Firmicutes bacterium]|nr:L-glutamate gamma-semialdehyde dehydrogenase [Bacillota bacterium]MCL2256082.1 L-glutamate gamma-semialdehyde dehydrogenase [Bacillota bacterium]
MTRIFKIPTPINEPVLNYSPNSLEKIALKAELERQSKVVVEIPLIIGGEEIVTRKKGKVTMPHNHKHVLANFSFAEEPELKKAVESAKQAKEDWSHMSFEHRAAIFLKAAELISTKYRALINAATMLGQNKTVHQAEIDSACELADFLRFNVKFAEEIYSVQPVNSKGVWNRVEYRPLDGFVAAISPFNFTAIGGNLSAAPALMGNTVVWKPAATATLSNYYVMQIFIEAGLPKGVINFVPSQGTLFSEIVVKDSDMSGVHFTGSTETFNTVWKNIANNLDSYKSYPRLVGETGGKDFTFVHNSYNDIDRIVTAIIRGAFEYQGQKCSACSRAYVPKSMWEELKKKLLKEVKKIKVGDVTDFTNFMGAVIDEKSFDNITKYIEDAKKSKDVEVLTTGYDKSIGWFIQPTIIETKDPNYITMKDELFGPVLTIFVYDDNDFEKTLEICDKGSKYALTGAIFAKGRDIIAKMEKALTYAAGNFYINDRCTGAVVGQQPFGGSRASGTNDKAGSALNLYRWINPRTIKETFNSDPNFEYPFMEGK